MFRLNHRFGLVLLLVGFSTLQVHAQEKPFEMHGTYVEGCGCNIPCACVFSGMAHGCQLVGVAIISSGTYSDADLSGAKIVFVVGGKWVRIFVQSKDSAQARAAGALGRALFSAYGKVEAIQNARIGLSGNNGNYTLLVNDGKLIRLKTQPVLGADKKTAVTYTNYPNPLFQTIMQAKVISGSYRDGKHHFSLKGTNAFFNQHWSTAGNI